MHDPDKEIKLTKKEQSNSKLFGIFPIRKKKSDAKYVASKSSKIPHSNSSVLTNVESSIYENENSKTISEENQDLRKQISSLEKITDELRIEIAELNNTINGLGEENKAKNKSATNSRAIGDERSSLRKTLKTTVEDNEQLKLEIAFLEEDKQKRQAAFEKLRSDFEALKTKKESCESNEQHFKNRLAQLQIRTEVAIREFSTEMCELIEENRFLIKKGIWKKPKEYQRVFKVADQYLRLEAENVALKSQIEALNTRLVTQELFCNDIVAELKRVDVQLTQRGVVTSIGKVLNELVSLDCFHEASVIESGDKDTLPPKPQKQDLLTTVDKKSQETLNKTEITPEKFKFKVKSPKVNN